MTVPAGEWRLTIGLVVAEWRSTQCRLAIVNHHSVDRPFSTDNSPIGRRQSAIANV
jgi:hypothetical protein